MWEHHEAFLAERLSQEAWNSVTHGYVTLAILVGNYDHWVATEGDDGVLGLVAESVGFVAEAAAALDEKHYDAA